MATHLSIALAGSGLIYYWFKDVFLALSFFAGSIVIDLDHFIDYFLYYGFRFNLRRFLSLECLLSGKVYIVLHSWELVFFLVAVSAVFDLSYLFFFSLAMAVHLSFDTIHRIRPLFYFLIYRACHKFDAHFLCPECLERLI